MSLISSPPAFVFNLIDSLPIARTSARVPTMGSSLVQQQAMATVKVAVTAMEVLRNPPSYRPRDLRPPSSKFPDQTFNLGRTTCTKKTMSNTVCGWLGEVKVRIPGSKTIPLLVEVLLLYHVTLPQLTPNVVTCLAIFEWAMWAEATEGRAKIFVVMHEASYQPKKHYVPVGSTMLVAFRMGEDSGLAGPPEDISYQSEAVITTDVSSFWVRLWLLDTVAQRISMRDLAEEFIALHIPPLIAKRPIAFEHTREGEHHEIPLDSIGPRVAITADQIVRAMEKVVGAPTVLEREQRLKLVGAWEGFNRVWSANLI
ncbi:hypothetical protein GUJ93_ZPchr0006g41609 [Zizania palustris]|uniref:Uncharacterized protein n=1 Tax=Zizania palustris TaxID=103762 RepID=A0A8J5T5W1_ZIZPA|nr:hypothetical protein GUJ93_ZPchr0006g41609 [Zizania palustris]